MEIIMGSPILDRASQSGVGYTYIIADNPAHADGTIKSVSVRFSSVITGDYIKIAIFRKVSGNNFTTVARAVKTIPNGESQN